MAAVRTLSEAIDNVFTTTWKLRGRKIVDQIFQIRPLLKALVDNNRIVESVSGGRYKVVPIQYSENDDNVKWVSKAEEFGLADPEFLTEAEYEWKYFGTSITRTFQDDQQNRGPAKLHDYVEAKIMNARDSLMAQLERDMFTDNASGKAIDSLETLIADDPTSGTIGGISRASYSWWRNQTTNFATGSLTIEANLIDEMRKMMHNCSKYMAGSRPTPDIIVTGQTEYEHFEARAEALQQIQTATTIPVSLGFGSLAYKGTPLVWAPQSVTGRMLFLSTEHMKLWIDRHAYFNMGEWKEKIGNRDRATQIMAVMCLGFDNFQKQGTIYNIDNASDY